MARCVCETARTCVIETNSDPAINELLVDSLKSLEKVVRRTAVVLLRIGQVMLSCTHFTVNPFDTIPTTSSSISH